MLDILVFRQNTEAKLIRQFMCINYFCITDFKKGGILLLAGNFFVAVDFVRKDLSS